MTDATPPRIVRVDPATVIIFSVLFSPLLIGAIMGVWAGKDISNALGLFALYVGVVYWICSPTLELGEDQLTYRALLVRRSVMLSMVSSIKMAADPAPTIRLLSKHRGDGTFSFIIKPFSKAGVVALLQYLQRHCPNAQFDETAMDLSRGDFKSITRLTIGGNWKTYLLRIGVGTACAAVAAGVVRWLLNR